MTTATMGINNYFKVYRNQVFPFNDKSDLSTSRALNLATILSRGGKIVVWKKFLGMPSFLQVVGEVPDYIPTRGRPKRLLDHKVTPRLPTPAEPDGGADDYPSPESEEEAAPMHGVAGKATNGAMG